MRKKRYATKDFTFDMLPSNRFEVFKDVFKNRYKVLLACGGALILFALPMILIYLTKETMLINIYRSLEEKLLEEQEALNEIFYVNNLLNIFMILGSLLFSLSLAGVIRIITKLVHGEGISFFSDFFTGIKVNYKTFLGSFLFFSIIYYAIMYVKNATVTYSLETQTSTLYYYMQIFILLFIIAEIVWIFIMQSVQYKNTFSGKIKNAFILYIKAFPKWLIMSAFNFLFYSLFLIFSPIVIVFLVLLYLLVLPLVLMLLILVTFQVFDQFINKEAYPELYDKGIWRK